MWTALSCIIEVSQSGIGSLIRLSDCPYYWVFKVRILFFMGSFLVTQLLLAKVIRLNMVWRISWLKVLRNVWNLKSIFLQSFLPLLFLQSHFLANGTNPGTICLRIWGCRQSIYSRKRYREKQQAGFYMALQISQKPWWLLSQWAVNWNSPMAMTRHFTLLCLQSAWWYSLPVISFHNWWLR